MDINFERIWSTYKLKPVNNAHFHYNILKRGSMKRMTIENFENSLANEKGLFMIKFFSPTCGPCRTMGPVFEKLNENNPNLNIYEIDTMESPELASHFGVRGVPHVVYCENREVLYSFTGLTPLGNLQYVINHIDDPYFRENGEFRKDDSPKKWTFEITVGVILFILILAIAFL